MNKKWLISLSTLVFLLSACNGESSLPYSKLYEFKGHYSTYQIVKGASADDIELLNNSMDKEGMYAESRLKDEHLIHVSANYYLSSFKDKASIADFDEFNKIEYRNKVYQDNVAIYTENERNIKENARIKTDNTSELKVQSELNEDVENNLIVTTSLKVNDAKKDDVVVKFTTSDAPNVVFSRDLFSIFINEIPNFNNEDEEDSFRWDLVKEGFSKDKKEFVFQGTHSVASNDTSSLGFQYRYLLSRSYELAFKLVTEKIENIDVRYYIPMNAHYYSELKLLTSPVIDMEDEEYETYSEPLILSREEFIYEGSIKANGNFHGKGTK